MRKFAIWIIGGCGALLLAGCSTTKHLPEGEVLYTGVKKMTIVGDSGVKIAPEVKSEITSLLSVAPNNSLISPYVRYPFPLGLWVWNYMQPKKEKGFKRWLYNRLVSEPVLISGVQPDLRTKVAGDILANNGYFHSTADYELIYSKRNPRKARITYRISAAAPSLLNTIAYPNDVSPLTHFIDSLYATSLLHRGNRYALSQLSAERERITDNLRNNGYYYFRPEYLEYLADTTQTPGWVDLRLVLRKDIPQQALQPYRTGNISITLNRAQGNGIPDTVAQPRYTLYLHRPVHIRRSTLQRAIELTPGEWYSVEKQQQTQTNLDRLGIFRSVSLQVTPADSLIGRDSLNVAIEATFAKPIELYFEANVTSKSNSYIGPGVILGINHRNIFGGGEQLSTRLNGSYEWQTGGGSRKGKASLFNSYEFGLTMTLTIPRIFPGWLPQRKFTRRYAASTQFELGARLLNRPHYFRMLSLHGSYTYNFQTSANSTHTLVPVKLSYNKLLHTTEAFDQTMQENPAIALSFNNQFIPTSSYIFTYDTSPKQERTNRLITQLTAVSSGNILWGIMSLTGEKGEKKIFGTPFSQFVKGIAEFRYYYRPWEKNWIVTRLLVGAGLPYENSTEMPYTEQFYIGGANSIRAFTIRSLGPGSYTPPKNDANGYFDQTGTFKFEANIEYRFPIVGNLNGAVFVDTGNIWLLKKDEKRPGGTLQGKTFFRDLALGTGFGLRYDISFLVLRGDLGIGIHAPYDTGKHGYYNMNSFWKSLAFHLAIGYPF